MWFANFHGCDAKSHNRCNFWDNLMFGHCSCYEDDYDDYDHHDHHECRDSRRNEAFEQKCFKIKDDHSCMCKHKDNDHREWNSCGCKKEHSNCGCKKHSKCKCHNHRGHHGKKCNCGR
jgi:hypothetical protein